MISKMQSFIREIILSKLLTFGRNRMVTKAELLKAVNEVYPNTDERIIRLTIEDIEMFEHSKEYPEYMFCSCDKGYYIATNREEAQKAIDFQYKMFRGIIDRYNARKIVKNKLFPEPIKKDDLFFEGGENGKL